MLRIRCKKSMTRRKLVKTKIKSRFHGRHGSYPVLFMRHLLRGTAAWSRNSAKPSQIVVFLVVEVREGKRRRNRPVVEATFERAIGWQQFAKDAARASPPPVSLGSWNDEVDFQVCVTGRASTRRG